MDVFIKEQYKKLLYSTREQIEKVVTAAMVAGYDRIKHFASEEYYKGTGERGAWSVSFGSAEFEFEILFDELNGVRTYYIDKFIRDPKPSMVCWEISPDKGVSLEAILAKIEELKPSSDGQE